MMGISKGKTRLSAVSQRQGTSHWQNSHPRSGTTIFRRHAAGNSGAGPGRNGHPCWFRPIRESPSQSQPWAGDGWHPWFCSAGNGSRGPRSLPWHRRWVWRLRWCILWGARRWSSLSHRRSVRADVRILAAASPPVRIRPKNVEKKKVILNKNAEKVSFRLSSVKLTGIQIKVILLWVFSYVCSLPSYFLLLTAYSIYPALLLTPTVPFCHMTDCQTISDFYFLFFDIIIK